MVLADVPQYQATEQGYIRMSPGITKRNKGTFGCSPVPKSGTRAHSPKPPFYETALLFPLDRGQQCTAILNGGGGTTMQIGGVLQYFLRGQ